MSGFVVTGAAGFVGSRLSERLLEDGKDVRGIDRLSDYYDPALKRKNLERLGSWDNFEFVEADLGAGDVTRLLREGDAVFHLAAQAGVRVSWGSAFDVYLRDNIMATQHLLEAARAISLRKIVVASSSSVYGDAETFPVTEDAPLRPRSPYGVTKAATEKLVDAYHAQFGIPGLSLRYFTVYGPFQRPDMAFHRFIRRALEGAPMTVYGDGLQVRDYTFVDDIVQATIAAAAGGRPGEVYNVAGGSRASLSDVFSCLAELAGGSLALEYTDPMPGDVRKTYASTEKARLDLGYRPTVGLKEGMRKQFEWQALAEARIS